MRLYTKFASVKSETGQVNRDEEGSVRARCTIRAETSRKVRNLTGNSQCVITCEVGEDQLIVEEIAEKASDVSDRML